MSIPTFIHTITIFNKLEDKSSGKNVISWHKIILENCYFGVVRGESQSGNMISGNNTFVCRIPKNKAYVKDFKGLPGTFSISPGDIIVKGAIEENIKDVSGSRAADILNRYKESFAVKSFSDNTVLDFEPHYRASGG